VRAPPISLITVSRELGAGGSDFARELGAELGWPVLDRQIVHRVADRLRVADATVEHLDEHPPTLLARIAAILTIPWPDLDAFPPPDSTPISDAVARATTKVIVEAGASRPLIVVGHGAQCIFAARPDALHVRLVASIDTRIQRFSTRMAVDPTRAADVVRRADQDRQAYVRRHFHHDWRNPLLYHLLVNTTEIEVEESARLVAGLVWGRSRESDTRVAALPDSDPVRLAG
jgi:cytidylate kinase